MIMKFNFSSGVSLSGNVTFPTGLTATQVNITCINVDTGSTVATSGLDANGYYSLITPPSISVQITIFVSLQSGLTSDGVSSDGTETVASLLLTTSDMVLDLVMPGVFFTGTVVNGDGTPIPLVSISGSSNGDSNPDYEGQRASNFLNNYVTSATGAFSIFLFAPYSKYTLTFSGDQVYTLTKTYSSLTINLDTFQVIMVQKVVNSTTPTG
jgi:hypothetical protein